MSQLETRIFAEYSSEYKPSAIDALGGAGGLSGSRFWRVTTPAGVFALRRYPTGLVNGPQLDWIAQVLRCVEQSGPPRLPIPVNTRLGRCYVEASGDYWDLCPWLPGRAIESSEATVDLLQAAMRALAWFHQRGCLVPRSTESSLKWSGSPAVSIRLKRFCELRSGRMDELVRATDDRHGAHWQPFARLLLERFQSHAWAVEQTLSQCSSEKMDAQICIRDIWRDHVLFDEAGQVIGLIDFTSLGVDTPAVDIARLLGSFVEGQPDWVMIGLRAYDEVSPLSPAQTQLVLAIDRANVLLSCWNWIEWLFVEARTFGDNQQVERRRQHFHRRLLDLAP